MLHLIWGLLNLGLLIYFLIACFKFVKVARNHIGGFGSVVFVFGLLSFVGGSKSEGNAAKLYQIKTFNFAIKDSLEQNSVKFAHFILEDQIVTKYDLALNYGKIPHSEINTPISAYSGTTGLVIGTHWKPIKISVLKTSDKDTFKYLVYGILEWKLLGVRLYTQSKIYEGVKLWK
ncbi:hypothetical protein [Lacihabitans sp. CS3-21]|uniref:hypothetical protein n=1 Tax=Lacihabitans sp. CS3-21 TaxID=2487332 RepID=UPI0020CC735E|nr:hypothetical protein [Lacihabitans sp. CS3-21]MCP9748940.1 hypothetical protein [Lacihabitans sp. CS3-21]